jgi:hypothetical protein
MTVRQDKVHTHTFRDGPPVAVSGAHAPFECREFRRTVLLIQ